MNKKSAPERAKIIQLITEGCSLRSTARITDAAYSTVLKLVADMGAVSQKYHDAYVRNVACRSVQMDEIHSHVHKKSRHSEAWVWISMCADSKMVLNWYVGDRDREAGRLFVADLASRLEGSPHLVSDGLSVYKDCVEEFFGNDIKFSMLVKQYDVLSEKKKRYRGAIKKSQIGVGLTSEVSTSYIERQNLTLRMSCRRFARRSNSYSKTMKNHCLGLALHFQHYNYCRINMAHRTTPAMAAGLTDHVWSLEELVGLLDQDIPDTPPIILPPLQSGGLSAAQFRDDGRGRSRN